jgi:phosphatidylglycerophosphate synthase
MQIKLTKEQVPSVMSAGRALLGPVLIAGDACGWSGVMTAWLVVTALVSDIFDGVLARRWQCDTAKVRLFDSMADTVFYVCAAIALWIRVPQVWQANAGLLAVLVGLELARFGLDFAKFGKLASYHSYLAKFWGLVMASAVVMVFTFSRTSVLIPLALGLGIACDVEGLAMSLMLPAWRKDVSTLRVAWQLRGQMLGWIGKGPDRDSGYHVSDHADLQIQRTQRNARAYPYQV